MLAESNQSFIKLILFVPSLALGINRIGQGLVSRVSGLSEDSCHGGWQSGLPGSEWVSDWTYNPAND